MIEVLVMVSAVLLVLCLLLIAAVLGYQAMFNEASEKIAELERLADTIEKQAKQNADRLLEAKRQHVQAVEEITRLTGELTVAKLSIKNAQNQVAEHVERLSQTIADRDEYKDMLKNIAHIFANEYYLLQKVLKEWQDFEAQGG